MTKKEKKSFTKFMLRAIEKLEGEGRFGTAHVYLYALRAFERFVGGGEIFFGALSRRSLVRFEDDLRSRRCSWNTVSTYSRALRAVYHNAVDAEVISNDSRLFSVIFTGVKSEKKRALQPEQMRALLSKKKLPQRVSCSRDLLSLMFQLQGMPFVDLIHLHRDELHTDAVGRSVLSCRRWKTGTEMNVTVTAGAMKLINQYRSTNPTSPYLLNFFDGITTAEGIYREYCRQLRNLNYGLSRLPGYCNLKGIKVSSYTGRHTWATLAKYCQVPEEMISEGLAHSSLQVTRTYLKSFAGDELERANRMIVNYVFTGKKELWRG